MAGSEDNFFFYQTNRFIQNHQFKNSKNKLKITPIFKLKIAQKICSLSVEEDWHMPIDSSQYFNILFRVNQVFTFYHFIVFSLTDYYTFDVIIIHISSIPFV